MAFIEKETYKIYNMEKDIRIKNDVFELDEMIAPIISILNKKGYTTKFCCSGHLSKDYYVGEMFNGELIPTYIIPNQNFYILFDDSVKYEDFKNFPKGDGIEVDCSHGIHLCKNYTKTDDATIRLREMFRTMLDLLDWVEGLPQR